MLKEGRKGGKWHSGFLGGQEVERAGWAVMETGICGTQQNPC